MTAPAPAALEASIRVDAPPRAVWAVVSDLARMGEWSPQCHRMFVVGSVRKGARTVNINRQGRLMWPTSAKVVRYEPQRAIAFRITENRTVWSYELEGTADGAGTTVTERRDAPQGTTAASRFLISKLLGGDAAFGERLRTGMESTLVRIKTEAEAA